MSFLMQDPTVKPLKEPAHSNNTSIIGLIIAGGIKLWSSLISMIIQQHSSAPKAAMDMYIGSAATGFCSSSIVWNHANSCFREGTQNSIWRYMILLITKFSELCYSHLARVRIYTRAPFSVVRYSGLCLPICAITGNLHGLATLNKYLIIGILWI